MGHTHSFAIQGPKILTPSHRHHHPQLCISYNPSTRVCPTTVTSWGKNKGAKPLSYTLPSKIPVSSVHCHFLALVTHQPYYLKDSCTISVHLLLDLPCLLPPSDVQIYSMSPLYEHPYLLICLYHLSTRFSSGVHRLTFILQWMAVVASFSFFCNSIFIKLIRLYLVKLQNHVTNCNSPGIKLQYITCHVVLR